MLTLYKWLAALAAVVACLANRPSTGAERLTPDLVMVGKDPTPAELLAVDVAGNWRFRMAGGAEAAIRAEQLVRWSTPASPRAPDELWFTDGSHICLAPSWGAEAVLSLGPKQGAVETRLVGRVTFDRSHVRAILWGLPPDNERRQQTRDSLLAARQENSDVAMLHNGDVLTGTLIGIESTTDASDDQPQQTKIKFESSLGPLELSPDRLRGVALSGANDKSPSKPRLMAGMSDGSCIAAESLSSDGNHLTIASSALGTLQGRSRRDIASVQSFGRLQYLSDMAPTSYRFQPYLELHWPYRNDRNVLNAPIVVRNRRYLKGVGMHSAAQLTYAVDSAYNRFAATIAVDAAAEGGGSVTCRVLLRVDGTWQEAFESQPLHGSDEPRGVTVDLGNAKELALVVDFADRGDELDYANWLDARLEQVDK